MNFTVTATVALKFLLAVGMGDCLLPPQITSQNSEVELLISPGHFLHLTLKAIVNNPRTH